MKKSRRKGHSPKMDIVDTDGRLRPKTRYEVMYNHVTYDESMTSEGGMTTSPSAKEPTTVVNKEATTPETDAKVTNKWDILELFLKKVQHTKKELELLELFE